MANGIDNLIPFNVDTAREAGRRGAEKTNEIKRQKKTFKEIAKFILEQKANDNAKNALKALNINESDMTNGAILAASMFKAALRNYKAAETLLKITGDYTEKIEVNKIDENVENDIRMKLHELQSIDGINSSQACVSGNVNQSAHESVHNATQRMDAGNDTM